MLLNGERLAAKGGELDFVQSIGGIVEGGELLAHETSKGGAVAGDQVGGVEVFEALGAGGQGAGMKLVKGEGVEPQGVESQLWALDLDSAGGLAFPVVMPLDNHEVAAKGCLDEDRREARSIGRKALAVEGSCGEGEGQVRGPRRQGDLIGGTDELMDRAIGAEKRGARPRMEVFGQSLEVELEPAESQAWMLPRDDVERRGEGLKSRHGLGQVGTGFESHA